ncbi:excinuclease ABC subunit UvrC [Algoriphagus halophytocola]|uniref:UvrABC system protein C n=1 Tax=Algoriphagus halophytocola TaxID=2991499 RepID=A0ABY6MET9_9BACT|nr:MULTISPECIES: excinuclease ABC subunit UvrC [unclassified Algoriphagus]UZD21934.1 excinuclease ABC subunit UvrC [Algoriphagus sp. TR-M5]WBL43185.1 excinuclease ABC subunit UvrC [Algoriphagus sp. TR-M9]
MQSSSFLPDQHLNLPDHPGVYKYFNEADELIYVGKAKSLRKRVSSYFNKNSGVNLKTKRMVREIRRIEITLVNSEFDALLLENNLIKKSQPKYNILLRDDKTYPYLLLTKENFPRIFPTRKMIPKRGTYFGPFASVKAMNNVLDLIRELFTIRTCKLDLSPYKIAEGKYKVCLEYHIGNCQGPCEGLQNEADYLKDLEHAKHILKGNLGLAKAYFKQEMQHHAENLAFEKAQKLKEKLDLLEKYQAKSLIASPSILNLDVCTIVSDEKNAFVNYMRVKNGALITSKNVELKKKLDETDEQLLLTALIRLQDQFHSDADEVLLNVPLTETIDGLNVIMPKIGDKKKLIELSLKNALYYKKEKALLQGLNQDKKDRVIRQLQQDLSLPEIPDHIECFDNSNIQGTSPVASMVCFLNGKPAVKEYRHYHIKTVVGPDDFASMKEVVGRRYKRLLEENKSMPKLVVIDGGKGQLSSAVEALKELGVYGQMPIIGIAKRLEEIYFPGDSYPIHIDKKSESLRLLQRIRDEAHRFAITFHRKVRSSNAFGTQLTAIPGIGKNTADKLLSHFKSVKKLSEATESEVAGIIGASKAKSLLEWVEKNKGA